MSVAPAVLTEPILTTREAQPVVLVSSEEVLCVRTPAYSKTKSDLSWLIRQPSSSAICSSYVELLLDVSFELSNGHEIRVRGPYNMGLTNTKANRYRAKVNAVGAHAAAASDYGFWPELLPIQNKCVRNAVLTINGSSQSLRMSEIGKEYNLMHLSRDFANKIGGGINDYKQLGVYSRTQVTHDGDTNYCGRFSTSNGKMNLLYADPEQRQRQTDRFMAAHINYNQASEIAQEWADNKSPQMLFREPLYLGPFSAFQGSDSFPAWSCEGQKSAGLLHVHTMQLQLAMEDGWQKQLYLAVTNSSAGDQMAEVVNVEIHNAFVQTKWYLPPPRMVSAALTQTVSYATWDVLRFIADPNPNMSIIAHGSRYEFTMNAVSFPYMPSLFCFSIAPLYQHSPRILGNRSNDCYMLEQIKGDKRGGISHIDLTINTSAVALPYKGGNDTITRSMNARDLYNMTMQNVANYTEFPYTFEEWYQNCGFVAVSPAQLSGTLNSPNIRGAVVVQGKVFGTNMMGHPINISRGFLGFAATEGATGVYQVDAGLPRYQCVLSGFYSNRSLVLDAKSGLLNENTFSAAFQQNLRLGVSSSA